MTQRTSHRLRAVAYGLDLETRARCQDDNHPAACFNPCLNATLCHCGRIWYAGSVPLDRWADRDARLTSHIPTTPPCGHQPNTTNQGEPT